MKISVGNINCKLYEATQVELDFIARMLSYTVRKYDPLNLGSSTVKSFLNEREKTFPSGHLPLVEQCLFATDIAYELSDLRRLHTDPNPPVVGEWLRDYQHTAVKEFLKAQRGILQLPTGAGKSEIAISVIESLNVNSLFLVHQASLGEQILARYKLRTGKEGVWFSTKNNLPVWSNKFTVAMVPTLARAVGRRDKRVSKLLDNTHLVIVDECHMSASRGHTQVLQRTVNAPWRLGLSGTPLNRSDGRDLQTVSYLGPVVYKLADSVLIDAGVLAKPKIHMPKFEHDWYSRSDNSITSTIEWRDLYNQGIVNQERRNILLLGATIAAPKPAMVFVRSLQHGEYLATALNDCGVSAKTLFGEASIEDRQAAIEAINNHTVDVVVTNRIFREGVDVPGLLTVVCAGAGKSIIETIQQLGRGTRTHLQNRTLVKTEFTVIDIFDTGEHVLERHAEKRLKSYTDRGFEVTQ